MEPLDLIGLLRVRPNCCLFTWRQRREATTAGRPKTIEVDDRHCEECLRELERLAPAVRMVDKRSRMTSIESPCRVLVVDDDPDICDELERALGEMGCEVVTAANGHDALRYLRSGRPLPALILLDLMMPAMDGDEFLEHQLADPALAAIPVVVVTARASLPRCAPASIVHKPFRMETIGNLVERHRRS